MLLKTHRAPLYVCFTVLCGIALPLLGMDMQILPYDTNRDSEAAAAISREGSEGGIEIAHLLLSPMSKVARIGGKTVGFIDYALYEASDTGPACAYIEWLGVAQNMRRQGIGRGLLAYAIRDIQSHHYNTIELTVWLDNESAIRLYESYGFVKVPSYELRRDMSMIRRRKCSSCLSLFSWLTSCLPYSASEEHTE